LHGLSEKEKTVVVIEYKCNIINNPDRTVSIVLINARERLGASEQSEEGYKTKDAVYNFEPIHH
jgi:hypothetical protein